MNTNANSPGMDTKVMLSTLWLFVLLNMIFRDIHEFIKAEFIQEILTGIVNGTQITEGLLLIGAIMIEIPIAMVLLSRVLKYSVNRWANIIISSFNIALIIINRPGDYDDIFFAAIEIAALLLIIRYAWKWSEQEA